MAYTALSPPSNWAHAWKTARRLNQGRKAKTKIVTKEFVRIPKVTIPGGFTGDAAFLSLLTNYFVTTFAFPFLPWLSCAYDRHVSDVVLENALTFFEGKPAKDIYICDPILYLQYKANIRYHAVWNSLRPRVGGEVPRHTVILSS